MNQQQHVPVTSANRHQYSKEMNEKQNNQQVQNSKNKMKQISINNNELTEFQQQYLQSEMQQQNTKQTKYMKIKKTPQSIQQNSNKQNDKRSQKVSEYSSNNDQKHEIQYDSIENKQNNKVQQTSKKNGDKQIDVIQSQSQQQNQQQQKRNSFLSQESQVINNNEVNSDKKKQQMKARQSAKNNDRIQILSQNNEEIKSQQKQRGSQKIIYKNQEGQYINDRIQSTKNLHQFQSNNLQLIQSPDREQKTNKQKKQQMTQNINSHKLSQAKSSAVLETSHLNKISGKPQQQNIQYDNIHHLQINSDIDDNSQDQQSNMPLSSRLVNKYRKIREIDQNNEYYTTQVQNNNQRELKNDNNSQYLTERANKQIQSQERLNSGNERSHLFENSKIYPNNNKFGDNSRMLEDKIEQKAIKMRQKLTRDHKRIMQQQELGLQSQNEYETKNKSEFNYRRQSNQSVTQQKGRDHVSNQVHELFVSTPISQQTSHQNIRRNQSIESNPLQFSRNEFTKSKHTVNKNLANYQAEDQHYNNNTADIESNRNFQKKNELNPNDSKINIRFRNGAQTTKHRMQASQNSLDDFEGISQNLIAPDEDDINLVSSQGSLSVKRKNNKVQTQYRINLPKVNKKGIQIVINKDQTQTIVGNIQKLNHKFQSKVIKLESILPNSSQTISKKNFERNLKNANEEIQRLRKELNDKNRIIENLSNIDPQSQRMERGSDYHARNNAQTRSLNRDNTSQMQREYSKSGLETNSERKSSENTFRIRKLQLKRQNTEQELTRASSQPVMISRRNIIFKKDQDDIASNPDDYEFKSQDGLSQNRHNQTQSVEISNRLGSAVNIGLNKFSMQEYQLRSIEQTPVASQGQLSQSQSFETSAKQASTFSDPRFRKFKSQKSQQHQQDQVDSPKNSTTLPQISQLQLKMQIHSSQNRDMLLKTADLDVLEERDEQEEDGDKLTREGFFKQGKNQTQNSNELIRIQKSQLQSQGKKQMINQSNQGLSLSQMKSTAVTLKQQTNEWNNTMITSQSKFNSIVTPKNHNRISIGQQQNQKNNTNTFNYTEKNVQTMNRKTNKSQQNNQLKQHQQKRHSQHNSDMKPQLNFQILSDQDQDKLINPILQEENDLSPVQNYTQDFDDEPDQPLINLKQNHNTQQQSPIIETPKRGQQIPKQQKKQKDQLKSSFELLQEIQRNEQSKHQYMQPPNTQQLRNLHSIQDSPVFATFENNKVKDKQILQSKTFEYQQDKNDQITNIQIKQQKQNNYNTTKPLVKRLEVFYEDDIDDEYLADYNSPDQQQESLEDNIIQDNADISFENFEDNDDVETPQIFTDTLYNQNPKNQNKFIQQQVHKSGQYLKQQPNDKQQNFINPFAISNSHLEQQEEDQIQESMDFIGSFGSKVLQQNIINNNNDILNIRSSAALIQDQNINMRASAVRYSQLESQLKNYQQNQQINQSKVNLNYIDEEDELCRYQNSSFIVTGNNTILTETQQNFKQQMSNQQLNQINQDQQLNKSPSMQSAQINNNLQQQDTNITSTTTSRPQLKSKSMYHEQQSKINTDVNLSFNNN